MNKIVVSIILVFGLLSCSDSPTIPNAIEYEINKISAIPGYSWFKDEYDEYEPDAELIQNIIASYNMSVHKFVFFTRPSCTCPGEHLAFPHVYKILQSAGISTDAMEFYSMTSNRSKHRYEATFTVNKLPSFVVFKSGVPVYSITDTLSKNVYLGITYPIKFEELLLEALKK